MQQFGASTFNTVVHWHKSVEVDNECTSHNSMSWLSLCQKLSDFVEIWRCADKNNFVCFLLGHGVVLPFLSADNFFLSMCVHISR